MFIKVPLCVVKCGGDFTFLIANNWHFPMLLSIIPLRLLVVQS